MLVDSHCHLDVTEFDADRDAVVRRARAAGVTHQIVPAIRASTWPQLSAICGAHVGLHAAFGLHPVFLPEHSPEDLDALRARVAGERPVAIGECGLDFFVDGLDRDMQRMYFDAQLRLAREFDLPVIVHARRAVDAVIDAIRRVTGVRGVIHSWSGSDQQARQLLDLGFMLGIGGPVTYPRATRLRGQVATMPLDQMLLETDAPDQPDADARGGRNEPGYLVRVCAEIAALRGMTADEIAAATTRNARRMFALGED